MMVLSQQLADARADNERLMQQVRDLEAQPRDDADDLTRIEGIEPSTALELANLGFSTIRQIAELNETDRAGESHVLHGMHGRIIRDSWIQQAAALLAGR